MREDVCNGAERGTFIQGLIVPPIVVVTTPSSKTKILAFVWLFHSSNGGGYSAYQ